MSYTYLYGGGNTKIAKSIFMSAILIVLGVLLLLITILLFLFSKSYDPSEKKKQEEEDMEETSERIVYMSGYKPMWEKKIEL